MTINKSDFILQLCEEGYTKKNAIMVVNDFLNLVERNLQEGNSVSFYGFGLFGVHHRKARACPNFSGERITIKAHYVPKFFPGDRLKKVVKLWEESTKKPKKGDDVDG